MPLQKSLQNSRLRPTKVRGLIFEHGSFIVRMVVPKDVRTVFGKSEFRRNLKTDNRVVAAHGAEEAWTEWKGLIEKARTGETPEHVAAIIEEWKSGQSRKARGHRDTPENELVRLLYLAVTGSNASGLDRMADGLGLNNTQAVRGMLAKALVDVEQAQVFNAKADAAAEQAQAARSRAALFERSTFGSVTTSAAVVEVTGWSINSFYQEWLKDRAITPDRVPLEKNYVRALREFLGGDVDLSAVSRIKAAEFWRLLKHYPARRTPEMKRQSFPRLSTSNEKRFGTDGYSPPLSDATLKQWSKFYRRYFDRAICLRVLADNPFSIINVVVDNDGVTGDALTASEIERLFSLPQFRALDAWTWPPVCMLFTGCRVAELIQSPLSDVEQEDGIWVLNLRNRSIVPGDPLRVKNSQSQRLIPLHPHLIELGFLDYVQRMRDAGETHLFPAIGHHTKAGVVNSYSKFGNRLLRLAGVKDRVLYDLRHTFKRAARDAEVAEEVHDLLTGHSNGKMGRRYGQGTSVETLARGIAKIAYPSFPL